ncbi:MAG: hypothetical protein HYR55_14690 [Acidobacteria bacterium]|nr:hypothetical protein [Acidobacteriota bacterium]MBI3655899.1 hypothetical protein [Acidobacteriota bacterium]
MRTNWKINVSSFRESFMRPVGAPRRMKITTIPLGAPASLPARVYAVRDVTRRQGCRRSQVFSGVKKALAIFFLLVGFTLGGTAPARPLQETDIDRTITSADLLKAEGRLLGKGSNTEPRGPLGVKSYRLEEIALAKAINAEVKGTIRPVKKLFRLTINTETFPVRAIPPVVWVGQTKIDKVLENENLDQFIAFIFDDSVLKDGETLAVSFGEGGDSYSVLKEKLKLNGNR